MKPSVEKGLASHSSITDTIVIPNWIYQGHMYQNEAQYQYDR